MNDLIIAFCNNGGYLEFTPDDKHLWFCYKTLTADDYDYLRILSFGFSVNKIKTFSHTETRLVKKKFLWIFNYLDKQMVPVYKDVITVKMFPVPRKPTLEVL
jgi:hypothetical protein